MQALPPLPRPLSPETSSSRSARAVSPKPLTAFWNNCGRLRPDASPGTTAHLVLRGHPLETLHLLADRGSVPDGDHALWLAPHRRVPHSGWPLPHPGIGRLRRAQPEFTCGGNTLCVDFPDPSHLRGGSWPELVPGPDTKPP